MFLYSRPVNQYVSKIIKTITDMKNISFQYIAVDCTRSYISNSNATTKTPTNQNGPELTIYVSLITYSF